MILDLCDSAKNSILAGLGLTVFLPNRYFFILVIGYKNKIIKNEIELEIEETFDGSVGIIPYDIGQYRINVLFFDEKGRQKIHQVLMSTECILKEKRIVGFSDAQPFSDLEKIPCRISRLIQQYEDYENREDICEFGLVICNQEPEQSTMVASAMLDSLMHLFTQGEFEQLDKEIDEITELIRNRDTRHNIGFEPTSIKRFFLELSSFCFHAMYDQGVDVDRILNYEDPYETIFAFDETPKIKEWYMDSCRRLYAEYERMQSEKKSVLVGDIQTFITDNIHDENLSVNQIADSLNLSPAYISSCYSRETGNTIIGYIIEKRLDKAKELLEGTNLTVGEISRLVGYYSERYFYSAFKKSTGITPSQYRKKQHKIQKK